MACILLYYHNNIRRVLFEVKAIENPIYSDTDAYPDLKEDEVMQ